MGEKIFCKAVLVLFILLLGIMCTGCEEAESLTVGSLNEPELLKTEEVVKLLNMNGASITEATDFPINLSSCKISGKTPQPFISGETGVYYMFYEYEDYSETSELVNTGSFYEYPDCTKEYSDFLFPGSITGKNLYICLWCPELGPWTDGMEIAREVYEPIMEERSRIVDILLEQAFNKKEAMLIGNGDSWEVVMPVEYIYNLSKNKDQAGKIIFLSSAKTFVKYLKSEKEIPKVTSICWFKSKNNNATMSTDEGSLLDREVGYGFYKASSNDPTRFNPERDKGLTVTITWDNGEKEEIACKVLL